MGIHQKSSIQNIQNDKMHKCSISKKKKKDEKTHKQMSKFSSQTLVLMVVIFKWSSALGSKQKCKLSMLSIHFHFTLNPSETILFIIPSPLTAPSYFTFSTSSQFPAAIEKNTGSATHALLNSQQKLKALVLSIIDGRLSHSVLCNECTDKAGDRITVRSDAAERVFGCYHQISCLEQQTHTFLSQL